MTDGLVVRRRIRAGAAFLFDAWTSPALLLRWWGPKGVKCTHAEVDARVGGAMRIANELPDGRTIWIHGRFLEVVPGERLVYTWRTEPSRVEADVQERVTVRFEARGEGETDVVVLHERIADEESRRGHEDGWEGCLDGLAAWTAQRGAS
jgi:uncharacterized protein YndB with AHSA1/START domain